MALKEQVLNLFLDNLSGNISAADIRYFIEHIFNSKENLIRKANDSNDLIFVDYPIQENDLVVITEENNLNSRNGLYYSTKLNPLFTDLELVSYDISINTILNNGDNNQILATVNEALTWINQTQGYQIFGTLYITEILELRPLTAGSVYIANNTDTLADIPGVVGDGYSWTGSEWINIGQLRGPADTTTIDYLFSADFGNALPTTDPQVTGKLWNDAGFVKVSS